jgi:hypothetical protein
MMRPRGHRDDHNTSAETTGADRSPDAFVRCAGRAERWTGATANHRVNGIERRLFIPPPRAPGPLTAALLDACALDGTPLLPEPKAPDHSGAPPARSASSGAAAGAPPTATSNRSPRRRHAHHPLRGRPQRRVGGSAQPLPRSGIGDPDRLRESGTEVPAALPEVGVSRGGRPGSE